MTYGQLRNDTACNNAFFRGIYSPVDLAPFGLLQIYCFHKKPSYTEILRIVVPGLEHEEIQS